MKKTLLMAAVLVLAACGKKAETPAADTTSQVSPTPAPAVTDSSAMPHDTGMAHMDSAVKADTMARDTAKKK